jgi:hypothetical protein
MSASVRVYVNGRGVDAPAGGLPVDAVRIADPALADCVAAGDRLITDSRGLPVVPDEVIYSGAIFRVVANRKRDAAVVDESDAE